MHLLQVVVQFQEGAMHRRSALVGKLVVSNQENALYVETGPNSCHGDR